MAHECPDCGRYCYCDWEDHDQPAPPNCAHECIEAGGSVELDDFCDELKREAPGTNDLS